MVEKNDSEVANNIWSMQACHRNEKKYIWE